MSINQRSHSAAPSESSSYRASSFQRRGSLSPTEDPYSEYSPHSLQHHPQQQQIRSTQQQYSSRYQSRSATATPTGSPKKRQLPQVPHSTNRALARDRCIPDYDERGIGRFSRHRTRQPHQHLHHQQTYRSTGTGGWERHYTGLSDSDLTLHSLEPRARPKNSLSPDKDVMGEFGDSDMESVVSVTSSAFSTQSERPRSSKCLR